MTASHRHWQCVALSDDFAGLHLADVASPPCARGEVRIDVRAAALNFPDLLMARGLYQVKPPLPFVPGMECAGEVVEVGAGVEAWRVGDRVVHHAHTGAFSEQLVLPADTARPAAPGSRRCSSAAISARP